MPTVTAKKKMYQQQQSCTHFATATDHPSISSLLAQFSNNNNNNKRAICTDCNYSGPNLWICLYRNCLRVGCSRNSNDHSTQHNSALPSHCLHMNLSTERIWCYKCKTEVFIERENTTTDNTVSRSIDSGRSSYSPSSSSEHHNHNNHRVFAFERPVGLNVGMNREGGDNEEEDDDDVSDRSDIDDDNHQHHRRRDDDNTTVVGLVGLQNIGNTCYMNAALQALSNTVPLTKFFLDCPRTVEVLSEGRKPGLSRTYQALMYDIWMKKKHGGYVTPSGILYGIRNVHAMFRGYHQHDTQEFLRNFMDQLHEELKQQQITSSCDVLPSDSDTFSLAIDESHNLTNSNSSYDSSEGEYETCDSGVSERSSLSDDTERLNHTTSIHRNNNGVVGGSSNSNVKRRLSRSSSPGRKFRNRVIINEPQSSIGNNTTTNNTNSTSSKIILNNLMMNSKNNSKKQVKYRSIISDIFDGKLLSSVQCLTCDRVSSRVETFQDLSLPIPSRDHLVVLHGRTNATSATATTSDNINSGVMMTTSTTSNDSLMMMQQDDGWLSWILAWFKSWFYGPIVTLHDCLAAFFSTDELKGDNMYSCEKCNKLRNGIKFSKVLQLPEVLCIHLKRFRHELMFSSKISSVVSFPLKGLDMRPYLHQDCISHVTQYELFSVICHHGTAGGGHYICYALNANDWYEFDDQYVTRVSAEKVQLCEAYVLFYRKYTDKQLELRMKAMQYADLHWDMRDEIAYISRQWLCRFNTCAEIGPIDNSDFLCQHGFVHPDRVPYDNNNNQLMVAIPLALYDFLHKQFGGCVPVRGIHVCDVCQALKDRIFFEMDGFMQTRTKQQQQLLTHLLSTQWYAQWHDFIQKRIQEPPGPIDNTKITVCNNNSVVDLNECVEISEDLWNFFYRIYGGGPEIRLENISRNRINNNIGGDNSNSYNSHQGESSSVVANDNNHDDDNDDDNNKSMRMYCGGSDGESILMMDSEQVNTNNSSDLVVVVNGSSENNIPMDVDNNRNNNNSTSKLLNSLHINDNDDDHNKASNSSNGVTTTTINSTEAQNDVILCNNVEIKTSKRYRRRRKALSNT